VDDPRQGGEALGRAVSGLAVLAARYDLFLIDQYGVLHDGAAAYPGVVACLERLRAGGGKVVVLSNSGLRAADNEARLSAVGIARDLYDICLSSGEVAWRALAEGRLPAFVGARRCVLLTRGERPGFLDGLDLEMTEDAARADFVLLSGSDAPARGLADYARLLAPALARGVPMLCINPDLVMVTPSGSYPGAGAIARDYAAAGGPVTWIGKPHAAIYEQALALAPAVPSRRVLAVGDSVLHDIAGARRSGLDSLFVRGGLYAELPETALPALFEREGAWPDWIVPSFRWNLDD